MGFFFNQKAVNKRKEDRYDQIPILREHGCTYCPNRNISSDKYLGEGSKNPRILILTPYPLLDSEIKLMESMIPERMPRAYLSIVRCRMNMSFFYKTPDPDAVECCRLSIEKEIEKLKPQVVLGMGQSVFRWFLPEGVIDVWRGRQIPQKIGDHSFWFCPTFDFPTLYGKRRKDDQGRFSNAPTEYDKTLEFDVGYAVRKVYSNDFPRVVQDGYDEGVKIVKGNTEQELDFIAEKLHQFSKFATVAIDIETTGLRPFAEDARMLSVAIGTGDDVISFLLDHPESKFIPEKLALLQNFLYKAQGTIIAHNLRFELEWFMQYYGVDLAHAIKWGDSMGQAYLLDERRGALSLDCLTHIYFGFDLKKQSKVDRENLIKAPVNELLRYNGMDTKWEHSLYLVQEGLLPDKMNWLYKHTINMVKAVTIAMFYGFPVDKDQLDFHDKDLQKQLSKIGEQIQALPAVQQLSKEQGTPFNMESSQQLVKIFRDILRIPARKETKGGGYSTDKAVLEQMADEGIELAVLMREYRTISKLHSTFIQNVKKLHVNYILYTEFNTYITSTGRLSSGSGSINMQNYPKRKHKEIRNVHNAPEGFVILAADYGQIEARILAAVSQDINFCEAIRTDFDVHKFWAERVAMAYPRAAGVQTFEEYLADKSVQKAFRGIIKNTLVFPAFYGSSVKSIARSLNIPIHIMESIFVEFWETYPTIKQWQQQINHFANRNGYVENLLGRRRRMPIGWNELINMPIQSLSSDIVMNAMYRLSRKAWELGRPQYQPRLNIHDDLTFIVPLATLERDMLFIAKEMTDVPFDFLNVPIAIEVSVGKNWGSMKDIKVFKSTDFKEAA